MGEQSPKANESTTVFYRVRSVSGAVLTAWTDELAGFHQEQGKGTEKHVDSSSKPYTEPISHFGTEDPIISLKMGEKIHVKSLNFHAWGQLRPQKLQQNPATIRAEKALQRSAMTVHKNLLLQAKVQPQMWLRPSQMNKGLIILGKMLKAKNDSSSLCSLVSEYRIGE